MIFWLFTLVSLSLLLIISSTTFELEALVVPRSEVLREVPHCDVEMLLHSDRRQAAVGCDIHPDSWTGS